MRRPGRPGAAGPLRLRGTGRRGGRGRRGRRGLHQRGGVPPAGHGAGPLLRLAGGHPARPGPAPTAAVPAGTRTEDAERERVEDIVRAVALRCGITASTATTAGRRRPGPRPSGRPREDNSSVSSERGRGVRTTPAPYDRGLMSGAGSVNRAGGPLCRGRHGDAARHQRPGHPATLRARQRAQGGCGHDQGDGLGLCHRGRRGRRHDLRGCGVQRRHPSAPPPQADRRRCGRPAGRLLAGRQRRWRLHLRQRVLLGIDGRDDAQQADRRHGPDPRRRGLLAGRLGRRSVHLRRCAVQGLRRAAWR